MRSAPAICLTLFLCIGACLHAQEANADVLSEWYESSTRSGRYESVRAELAAMFSRAAAFGLPQTPLLRIVQEGAAKRVSASVLAEAVDAELERLQTVDRILQELELAPEDEPERLLAFQTMSLAMKLGIRQEPLRELLSVSEDLTRSLDALDALCEIATYTRVPTEHLVMVGTALIGGKMKTEGFESIPAFYLKGDLLGLSAEDVSRIIVRALESGGGIIQIDREISRRGRRR